MLAIPVPTMIREVRAAMPATVVTASLLNTLSTMNTLSKPRPSAATARSTASRTPIPNPQNVTPRFIGSPSLVSRRQCSLRLGPAPGGRPPPIWYPSPREFFACRARATGSSALRRLSPDTPSPAGLPHPLAVVLREYLEERHPVLRLHRLCDAAEMLVRFLATSALGEIVAAKGDDLPDAVRGALLEHLERPTLGQWIAILRAACRALPPGPDALAPEIRPLAEQLLEVMGVDGEPVERSVVALRNALA